MKKPITWIGFLVLALYPGITAQVIDQSLNDRLSPQLFCHL